MGETAAGTGTSRQSGAKRISRRGRTKKHVQEPLRLQGATMSTWTVGTSWLRRYHVSDAAEPRQPESSSISWWGQRPIGFGCVGGQRLPLGGDRGVAEGEGVAEPDPSQGPPQQAAERAREARQQDPFVGSGPRRACLRGFQSNDMGGTLVRSVGLVRAKARIGLKNLAYNMRRLVQLEPVSRRPCDDTRRRRPPGDGLEAEITQLERGRPENLGSGMAGAGDSLVKQYPPATHQAILQRCPTATR